MPAPKAPKFEINLHAYFSSVVYMCFFLVFSPHFSKNYGVEWKSETTVVAESVAPLIDTVNSNKTLNTSSRFSIKHILNCPLWKIAMNVKIVTPTPCEETEYPHTAVCHLSVWNCWHAPPPARTTGRWRVWSLPPLHPSTSDHHCFAAATVTSQEAAAGWQRRWQTLDLEGGDRVRL